MGNASSGLVWSFVGLALVVACSFVVAVYRASTATDRSHAARDTTLSAAATVAWLGLTLALGASGFLSFTSQPPTMIILVVAILALAFAIGTSRFGKRLATGIPLIALVAIQGFRFPLELMLHQSYVEGLMPVQMSFSGFNFDIFTGVGALIVAASLAWRPTSLTLVRVWNVAGIVLLVNILTIALLSAPTPFRTFHNEPANVWVTHAPWVWLPAVYVLAAIVGHILVYRRLRHELNARAAASAKPPIQAALPTA